MTITTTILFMVTRTPQRGFTIVELLIVIVVIGVLAAISVVAYNGIQQRAYASKAAQIANDYSKIIRLYQTENGNYPTFGDTPSGYACLGSASSFPAKGSLAAGACNSYGDTTSAQLNTKLLTYAKNLPEGALPEMQYGTVTHRGIYYFDREIYYYLPAGSKCPNGQQSTAANGGIECLVYLPPAL